MASLGTLLAAIERRGETWHAELTPNWLQGRTSYGGASSALAVAVAQRAFPDLPPLRSAQIGFVGPLGGRMEARATLLRRGRNSAFVRVESAAEGQVGLAATLLFVAERDSAVRVEPERPDPLPPRGELLDPPSDVAFIGNFERAPAGAWQRGVPSVTCWARLADRTGLSAEEELFAVADIPPPATMPLFPRPAPLSSMTWQVNLLVPEPVSADGWWLLQSDADSAAGGFSSQAMRMWNASGQLVAAATQTVALFV